MTNSTTDRWEPLVASLAAFAGIPVKFALNWINIESGGNPCAVGSLKAHGPDGNPRELGLAQFYNPDDLKKLGTTGAELRAYCIPGTQSLSRPMTSTEELRHINLVLKLITECRASANIDLNKVGAKWSRDLELNPDMRKITKLQHGLPGLSHSGLPAVTKVLGCPPRDWSEFRHTLERLPPGSLDHGTEGYVNAWPRILNNAEKTSA